MSLAVTGSAPPKPTGVVGAFGALRVLVVLSALMAFGSIATDMYLPALPMLGAALRADPGQIEMTVSGYLVGFSLGQLLWGPVGDRHGRRGPIAVGLALFVIGSVGCALSGNCRADDRLAGGAGRRRLRRAGAGARHGARPLRRASARRRCSRR